MSTLDALVREVEESIASGNPERRARSLSQLTELFVEHASKLKDDHVSVFDEVILRLAREVDAKARMELSVRLADIGNAPVGVVKDLAHDYDVSVAEPVLQRSLRLSEDDLFEVADTRDQGHLLAVSRRRTLSERVADVLVKRGDQTVVRTVAQNEGAKLSEGALASLAQKALGDNSLRSLLLKRLDVPDDRLTALADWDQGTKEEEKPKPQPTAEQRRMEAAIAKLATVMAGTSKSSRDLSQALERLARTAKGKPVEEVRVANWIKAEKLDEALAAIAHNAGLPAATIAEAYDTPAYEPLLVVMRAARLSWNTFKLLLTSRNGRVPPADVLRVSFEMFQQLPVPNAQQLGELIGSGSAEPAGKTAAA
jgi:uncharacterized protein (DUF2336 family)